MQEIPNVLEKCVHHWLIEPANEEKRWGTCQNCGASKRFKNYVQGESWTNVLKRSAEDSDVRATTRRPHGHEGDENKEDDE